MGDAYEAMEAGKPPDVAAELKAATAVINAVRLLHLKSSANPNYPNSSYEFMCIECGHGWPCPTAVVVTP